MLENSFQQEDIQKIQDESEEFQDIIIPQTEDTYHTVGMKLLAAFYWLHRINADNKLKWIIKLDDDVLVNMPMVDKFIRKHENEDKIFCRYNFGNLFHLILENISDLSNLD